MEPRDLFQTHSDFLHLRIQSIISCLFKRQEDRRLKFKHSQIRTPPKLADVYERFCRYLPSSHTVAGSRGRGGGWGFQLRCSNLTIWVIHGNVEWVKRLRSAPCLPSAPDRFWTRRMECVECADREGVRRA